MNAREEESASLTVSSAQDKNSIEYKRSVTNECNAYALTSDVDKKKFSFKNKSNSQTKLENLLENDSENDDILDTENEIQRSGGRLEPSDFGSSFYLYLMNKFHPKELEEDLGLNGNLLHDCFNYSQKSLITTSLPLKSTKYFSDETAHGQDVSNSFNDTEFFRMVSDSDSILSYNSSNLSCCSEESDHGSVEIRYDSPSSSSSSSLQNTSSFFRRFNTPYSTSSSRQTPCTSAMNESESLFGTRMSFSNCGSSSIDFSRDDTNSCTEEFQHDIEYLAKSEFRTSTPDPKEKDAVNNHSTSLNDSFTVPSSNKFVHGLSPLCGIHSSARRQSRTRLSVRRSLVYLSPVRNCQSLPNPEDFKSAIRPKTNINISRPIYDSTRPVSITPAKTNFPKTVFKVDAILPKIMFQDETEEAVYYLITKYLADDSDCTW